MKRYWIYLAMSLGLAACSGEEMMQSPYEKDMGGLSMEAAVDYTTEIPVITKSADFSALDVEKFYIEIQPEDGGEKLFNDTYTAFKNAGRPFLMNQGRYRIVVGSRREAETTASSTPYFAYEGSFLIQEKTTTNLSVTCAYESLGVELILSEQLQAKIEERPNYYSYTVSVSNGAGEWSFDNKENMEPGYFRQGCEELVVKVKAFFDGREYPIRTYRIKNNGQAPQLGEYYIITLDAGEEPETNEPSLRAVQINEVR